ncbi:hypothetical protein [Coleofasciculus sp. F4-SAH-05]|uniref:hypothetical protein n=1 Tax=Coleofasciculus sp. F4-SAH-05 TaxID=3069525 RepID=UPI003303DCCD
MPRCNCCPADQAIADYLKYCLDCGISYLSFVICHLSFVICHLSFVICHLSFVICHLS